MSTNSRFASVLLVALASSPGLLLGQEDGCFESPENIPLNLDGGNSLLGGGSLTADGLTLYYDAWAGTNWILKVTRESAEEAFEPIGRSLGDVVNAPGTRSWAPRISADGRWLYFTALSRSGPTWDIWVAWKGDPEDPDVPGPMEDFDQARAVPELNKLDPGGGAADR